MSGIAWLSAQPFVHSLGWTLIHFVWQGALLGAACAVAFSALRDASANTRYLVGVLTLVLMAAAPVATLFVMQAGQPWLAPTQPAIDAAWFAVGVTVVEPGFHSFMATSLPWVVAAWLVGVLALSVRVCAGWWQVQSLRRHGVSQAPDWIADLVARLAADLRVPVRVRVMLSSLVDTPTVIGWMRPVILLPASTILGLTPQQLEMVIAHELGHIRRFDYLINLIQVLVTTLLFYHPAVRWVSDRVRIERENCCDDIAIAHTSDRLAYARTLAAIEAQRSARPFALAMGADGGNLLGRIRRVFGDADAQLGRARVGWIAAVGATAVVLATVVATRPLWVDTPEPETAADHLPERVEAPVEDPAERPVDIADLRSVIEPPVETATDMPELSDRELRADMERAARSIAAPPQLPRPEVRVATTLAPLPAPLPAQRDRADDPEPTRPEPAARDDDDGGTPEVIDTAARPAIPQGVELVVVRLPDAIHTPAPEYPAVASRRGVPGAVTASFVVTPDGAVDEVRVLGVVGGEMFSEAVVATLAEWRFEPPANGRHVEAVQTFRFEPQDDAVAARECAVTGSRLCRQRRNWVTAEQRQNLRVITSHVSVGAAPR